jgi:uncharacterized protein GlcG (DUF336 family)
MRAACVGALLVSLAASGQEAESQTPAAQPSSQLEAEPQHEPAETPQSPSPDSETPDDAAPPAEPSPQPRAEPAQPQEPGQPLQQPAQPPVAERAQAADAPAPQGAGCADLPDHGTLAEQLRGVVAPGDESANGGLGNHVWAATVDRQGTICAVVRSGDSIDEQWLGSRAIAASKAFTANAFSLPGFALSTANLYWPSQPESSLYDLGLGNPLNVVELYEGDAETWGTANDPLTGRRIGGTTVFGGGLALYAPDGRLLGAIGISGDESCTDHVIAWRLRHALNLDNVPDGPTRQSNDNIIYDLTVHPASGQRNSASGYGHPTCSPDAKTIAERFPQTAPTGPD